MTIVHLFLVGIGGFFGAISRYVISKHFNHVTSFPFGTFAVNLIGSFLLGMTVAKADIMMMLLFGTGFLGAFTTFSTFQSELIQMKKKQIFMIYLLLTYGLGILLAYFGFWIVHNNYL